MGILLSFFFPPLFMSSQFSSSSSSSAAPDNSRPTSPASEPDPSSPSHHLEDDVLDPSPPSSPKSSVIASPPLDTRPYSPHGVGIGILSPQPVLGPFAPITRANLSPLQVRSSPVEQRSNPLESIVLPRRPSSPFEPYGPRPSGSRSPEIPQPSPQTLPALGYVEDASTQDGNAGEHIPLTTFSSAGIGQVGLHISIPPPNPTASTSTPSPPLLAQPTQDPVAHSLSSTFDPGPSGPILETPAPASAVDLLASSDGASVDFTEFDTEGCSALEKIYLFSRSRASFHRVFIAHALPRYLLGAGTPAAEVSSEVIEQITPSDAVEYVLPLLNYLAMDEDEAVKEALAAELVPIIWWFITHCKLVEDDTLPPPSPPDPTSHSSTTSPTVERQYPFSLSAGLEESSEEQLNPGFFRHAPAVGEEGEPALVSVQAFTPILGTLLLSPNGIVGGSARYAVVELLRRLRHADQKEKNSSEAPDESSTEDKPRTISPTPSQASQVEYQELEDSLDTGLLQRDERRLFEHELVYQVVIGMGRLDMEESRAEESLEDAGEIEADSGPSTAVPTPQAHVFSPEADSYFPPSTTLGLTSDTTSSGPVLTEELPASDASAVSPLPSPSPPISSTSSLSGSPDVSTPSLTSSTSSSSGESADNAEPDGSDRLGLSLASDLCRLDDEHASVDVEDVSTPEAKLSTSRSWTLADTFPRHATLPTTPPFEVPPPSLAVPGSVDTTLPIAGLPTFQVQAASPAHETPPRQTPGWLSPRSAQRELQDLSELQDETGDLSEEAAVGRLSSMSLMAAVTASGSIDEDTKQAFVTEVERVGRDPVYWVRREASFAVGALAKVVPVEVVTSSLAFIPVRIYSFHCLSHCARTRRGILTPDHRRRLALDVILPLSQDEESTVRSAVLEALGEVMYTFNDDEEGPPEQLLKLFLGIRETEDPGGGMQRERSDPPLPAPPPQPPQPAPSGAPTSSAFSDYGTDAGGGPDIYEDPQRPLVCAFNYPAVTLTLGRQRWPELRSLYLALVQDPSFKVRRTLAASLGEMAKIIGEEHARADLMDVFWSSLHAEESEVRMKVLDAVQTFVRALGLSERAEVVKGMEEAFSSGKLTSWREREAAVKTLGGLVEVEGIDGEILKRMLTDALDDRVAAVREAAVAVMPTFVKTWRTSPSLLEALRVEIRAFATSPTFRRRTTYVTCVQEMLVSDQGDVAVQNGTFWDALSGLVRDPIVDVRIRVARLLALISDKFGHTDSEVAAQTVSLARDLAQDPSHEVQAFATAVISGASATGLVANRSPSVATVPLRVSKSAATFSRPPPPSPS
ncbi:ARM repeat-containing protein [Lentinus tigrinus ALCF2SS1-7]|uniref:ARM repeat-containing protein n=1 Tax=Lentinus tigrinus ALCF2SS1-6 TaxID=1328759 RepID=A0A5C2SR11_9APHY|nr:ARM repeat-containing protein [Lentinus tigrinus ALCF2SS1-6]RPD80244.1 ARM repeat-containing protein [Lentinus tigrinus ALCF2SS1-7]